MHKRKPIEEIVIHVTDHNTGNQYGVYGYGSIEDIPLLMDSLPWKRGIGMSGWVAEDLEGYDKMTPMFYATKNDLTGVFAIHGVLPTMKALK
jgi:hypothetical protein